MARIRSIKPEFWTSPQIVGLSLRARLLFIGLWNFADDGGVHPAQLLRLKMQVFPGDPCSLDEIEACVRELAASGLIREYTAPDEAGNSANYWIVTGWETHQKIDKPKPRYPKPAEFCERAHARAWQRQRSAEGDIPRTDDEMIPNTRRQFDESTASESGQSPRVRDGREGKGREGEESTNPGSGAQMREGKSGVLKTGVSRSPGNLRVMELAGVGGSRDTRPAKVPDAAHPASVGAMVCTLPGVSHSGESRVSPLDACGDPTVAHGPRVTGQGEARKSAKGGERKNTRPEMDRDSGNSAFAALTRRDLGDTARLVAWFDRESSANPRGLLLPGDAHRLECVAAAEYALRLGQNPVALFAWLIGKKQQFRVAMIDRERARVRLREWEFPRTRRTGQSEQGPQSLGAVISGMGVG